MKKILVTISLFCTMLVSNALALRAPIEPMIVETKTSSSWGIVIAFIAIVLVMLLIKIRINKKR